MNIILISKHNNSLKIFILILFYISLPIFIFKNIRFTKKCVRLVFIYKHSSWFIIMMSLVIILQYKQISFLYDKIFFQFFYRISGRISGKFWLKPYIRSGRISKVYYPALSGRIPKFHFLPIPNSKWCWGNQVVVPQVNLTSYLLFVQRPRQSVEYGSEFTIIHKIESYF